MSFLKQYREQRMSYQLAKANMKLHKAEHKVHESKEYNEKKQKLIALKSAIKSKKEELNGSRKEKVINLLNKGKSLADKLGNRLKDFEKRNQNRYSNFKL